MGHGSKKNPTTFAKRKSRAVIAKMLVKRRKEIRDNDKVEKNNISSTCSQNSISSDDTITDDVFATKSMSPIINKPSEISGRGIVDIGYLFSNLKSIKHEDFGCSLFDVNITNEKHLGLKSIFTYECNMCGQRGSFSSENSDAAVCGSIAIGIGQSQC
jgi:hypothetical protein